jgi:hypothetical protein
MLLYRHGTNGVLLYIERKVQLKNFFKYHLIKQILHSQTSNGAAFVPKSETSFGKAGKFLPAFLVGLITAAI